MGKPSNGWYCLGVAAPAREPVPAQGNKTKQRGADGEVKEDAPAAKDPSF
jgi:hypothetical protein